MDKIEWMEKYNEDPDELEWEELHWDETHPDEDDEED